MNRERPSAVFCSRRLRTEAAIYTELTFLRRKEKPVRPRALIRFCFPETAAEKCKGGERKKDFIFLTVVLQFLERKQTKKERERRKLNADYAKQQAVEAAESSAAASEELSGRRRCSRNWQPDSG